MLPDKDRLNRILDDIERGLINQDDVLYLRDAIERLDELDDLVDTVSSCRTQEIPVLREVRGPSECCGASSERHTCPPRWPGQWDDNAPGRP